MVSLCFTHQNHDFCPWKCWLWPAPGRCCLADFHGSSNSSSERFFCRRWMSGVYVTVHLDMSTLWWTYKKLWKITIFNGKIHYQWPFSIAMLVHLDMSRLNLDFFGADPTVWKHVMQLAGCFFWPLLCVSPNRNGWFFADMQLSSWGCLFCTYWSSILKARTCFTTKPSLKLAPLGTCGKVYYHLVMTFTVCHGKSTHF